MSDIIPFDNHSQITATGYVGYRSSDGCFFPDEQTYLRYEAYLQEHHFMYETVCRCYNGDIAVPSWNGDTVYETFTILRRQDFDDIITYLGFRNWFEKPQSWRQNVGLAPNSYPATIAVTIHEGKYLCTMDAWHLLGRNSGTFERMRMSEKAGKYALKG